MNFFTPALELNKYVSYKRLTFYIDLTVAIIFCQLGLAFCKRGSSTAWKRKAKKTLSGQTCWFMPLPIKCWQLTLPSFSTEHIIIVP